MKYLLYGKSPITGEHLKGSQLLITGFVKHFENKNPLAFPAIFFCPLIRLLAENIPPLHETFKGKHLHRCLWRGLLTAVVVTLGSVGDKGSHLPLFQSMWCLG